MSVANPHRDYQRYAYIWRRIRDTVEGRDALLRQARIFSRTRVRGSLYSESGMFEEYIQRLSNQNDVDYLNYCERASFFNASGRTVDALAGLIFAKPPYIQLPSPLDQYEGDITLSAMNLREFVQQVVFEELTTTRVGILVDYPQGVPPGLSRGDAERLNIRPFLRHYSAENILNWRVGAVNGAEVLTLVVLAEEVDVQSDEFTTEQTTRYRVLDLVDGIYRVRTMTDSDEVLTESFPTMNGAPMTFIPFAIVGGNKVRKPLLVDLVDTNIGHYRNSADYERGLHFTGLPTPYIAGVQLPEGVSLQIGSTSAWVFPDPSAKADFLEFSGTGLSELREAMRDKERRMAVLGARMLADEKRQAEALGTMEMRTAGERSILAAVAYDVSDAMRRALDWMAQWVGAAQDVQFDLNVDYGARRMEPQMLTALMGAVQSDLMPMSVFFDNLKRGEIVQPDMEFESYQAELETQTPPALNTPDAEPATLMGNLRQRLGL
jgi:hypothetical protein